MDVSRFPSTFWLFNSDFFHSFQKSRVEGNAFLLDITSLLILLQLNRLFVPFMRSVNALQSFNAHLHNCTFTVISEVWDRLHLFQFIQVILPLFAQPVMPVFLFPSILVNNTTNFNLKKLRYRAKAGSLSNAWVEWQYFGSWCNKWKHDPLPKKALSLIKSANYPLYQPQQHCNLGNTNQDVLN